jgi:6-phosphogluconolactonase
VDGLNIDTHEPAVWKLPPDQAREWSMPAEAILCNLANQQTLFRTLVGLSEITGDPRYRQAAIDATRYAFDHLRHDSGLLYWGGHLAWDLRTDQVVGEGRGETGAGKHELKSNYPYYELMWEVDPKVTRRFVESFWSNHVLQWDNLDMNRHGNYRPVVGDPWAHVYTGGPVPFAGKGLTFMNTGSDLFFAGAMLHKLSGERDPLVWAKRMAGRYADVCDARTGLGADNYSIIEPDRMTRQFGAEFGNRFTEASVTSLYTVRYTRAALCQLKLAEWLGPEGEEFRKWAVADLAAYARHAYDPADHSFRATLIDGTVLSPADRKRDGYVELRWLEKRPVTATNLWAYALAWRLTGDETMWHMVREIGTALGLGDLAAPAAGTAASGRVSEDPETILALLELHGKAGGRHYLDIAVRVADRMIEHQFRQGFFVPGGQHLFARVDALAPLALLHLEAALHASRARIPEAVGGKAYFHCPFDGLGRTRDNDAIYARVRPAASAAPAGSRKPCRFYVGTYTGEKTRSKGIYIGTLDRADGTVRIEGVAAETRNPSFLALHPNGRYLYAISEINDSNEKKGGISGFAIDPAGGRLELLNQERSGGSGPCHLAIDPAGRYVMTANYSDGAAAVLPIDGDGRLGEPTCVVRNEGSGPNPQRQKGPHGHCAAFDAAGRHAFLVDLGLDQVFAYRLDAAGQLAPHDPPGAKLAPGAGPRHMVFHPGGQFAYVVNEMGSTLTAFEYSDKTGRLNELQTLSTLPAGFTGQNTTAEVQVHPSGRFVYGSNRGHDSIAVFSIDPKTGRITPAGHASTRGKAPRHFALDPSGGWMIAANQNSDNLAVFRVDGRTGMPSAVGEPVAVPSPACVLFVEQPGT